MKKIPRIPNRDVPQYVAERKEFTNSTGSLFSILVGEPDDKHSIYVVYSYGMHYPVYCHTQHANYVNMEKSTHTTGKHRSLVLTGLNNRPYSSVDTRKMREIMFKNTVLEVTV